MLAKKPLTDRTINGVKPALPGKRRLLWDAIVPGLALRVTDKGNRTFVLVTRYPRSRNPTPRNLGKVGAISLAEARDTAREWLGQIRKGVDPQAHEAERKAETFSAIASGYLSRVAKDLRSRGKTEATLARLVYPTFGVKPIDAITRSDVVRLLDKIEDENGPVMANEVLGNISRVMDWHATRSDAFRSPIVKGMKRAGAQERSRILTDDELRAVWRASGEYAHPFGPLLRFILLTATRRNEALYATRAEITGDIWTIPAARYKTKIDMVVPLSQAAQAALSSIFIMGNHSGYADGQSNDGFIFTTNGKQVIGGHSRHKAEIDKASGVTDWVIHDLRRTARSLMSRAGIASDHAERCLGHVISGVRGVYDRHEYLEEKRFAFEALASLVERIVNPSAAQANVVAIRGQQ
jgi:integrase